MSERMTLSAPITLTERTAASGGTWWSIEDAEGRSASTWSREVAEHLRQATEPVECEVDVKERDGRRYRNIVAIPGVVQRAQRGGGGRSLLTDRQVALLAASLITRDVDAALAAAPRLESWLAGASNLHRASPSTAPAATGGGPSGTAGPAPTPRAAPSVPASPTHAVEAALAAAFPGKPQLAERWLATRLREAVAGSVEELTDEQLAEMLEELERLAAQKGGGGPA